MQWPLIDGLIKSDVLSQWPSASQTEKRRILRTLSAGWERNEIAVRAGNAHCSNLKCSVRDHEHGALGPLVPHEGLQAALADEHQAIQQRSHGVWREDEGGEEPLFEVLLDSGDSELEERSNEDAVDEVVFEEVVDNLGPDDDELLRGAVNASLHPQEHNNQEDWVDYASDEDESEDESEEEETERPPAAPARHLDSGHNLPVVAERSSGLAKSKPSAVRASLFDPSPRSKPTSTPSGPRVTRTLSSLGGRISTKAVARPGMLNPGATLPSSRASRGSLRSTGRESRTTMRESPPVREERSGSAPAAASSLECRGSKRSRENESPAGRGPPAPVRSNRVPPAAAAPSPPGAAAVAAPGAVAAAIPGAAAAAVPATAAAAAAAAPSPPPALPPAGPSAPARVGQLAGREPRPQDRRNHRSSSSQGQRKKTSKRKN